MDTKYYTPDGRHPDDAIVHVKDFINELSNVQEQYFRRLTEDLNLSDEGSDLLFDYIYNSGEEGKYLTFEEHISFYKKTYKDMVNT